MGLSLEGGASCSLFFHNGSHCFAPRCLYSRTVGLQLSIPRNESRMGQHQPRCALEIPSVDNIILLAFHQLFSSMIIMCLLFHFFLTFWLCILNWDIVSDSGVRDGVLFVSSFTKQFRLFFSLHCNIHFIWLWRFRVLCPALAQGTLTPVGFTLPLGPTSVPGADPTGHPGREPIPIRIGARIYP